MSPTNKKGMTLMEMMVVVIIIVGLVLAAYPTYLSSLEKARAQEAVQLISHLAAAQDKFMAECYNMNSSTGECYYSADFTKLPVEIAGPNKEKEGNITVAANQITTPGYIYTMSGSGSTLAIVAESRRTSSYNYKITANVAGSEILCNVVGSDKGGKKICSAIGKATSAEGVYKID
ncbi:MAG: prepilin-type N-terminal cleavage/methylation domain-containing protein [Elusimicrobiota bacterium]|jgi:prepilin-type N-terminal cleavage/methylation domain-containing protein|nr:prepilin-type N-terminal cleavage/methylation domain-containing protein [Elusimicrobiota bacterium]